MLSQLPVVNYDCCTDTCTSGSRKKPAISQFQTWVRKSSKVVIILMFFESDALERQGHNDRYLNPLIFSRSILHATYLLCSLTKSTSSSSE